MTTSREKILNKLRAARKPFPDAPPRPKHYHPVTVITDHSPAAVLARFTEELVTLRGEVFAVEGDQAARDQVLRLLQSHNTTQVLAWDFAHIPVAGLKEAITEAGITIDYPDIHGELRLEALHYYAEAQVGLTGADAAAATTGALVVSTDTGKGRIPTVLPPVHLAVITQAQIVPHLEGWLAQRRATPEKPLNSHSNLCFIAGPSRTADIEKTLVLGMHGPRILQVVVKC